MHKRFRAIRGNKKGFTLVELLASCALLALLMLAVVILLVPFSKTFYRLRDLQTRETVADTLIEQAAARLRGATAIADPGGGETLAFMDGDGYVAVLSSAGLSGAVPPKKSEAAAGLGPTPYAFPKGQAALLYCSLTDGGATYNSASARGFDGLFGRGFYGGNTLQFAFSLTSDGAAAEYVTITVNLTAGGDTSTGKGIVDLSNRPKIIALTDANGGTGG